MLDNLPVGVLTVDYQHKVVDVNRAAWELLDRPKTTLPVNENQIFRHFSLLDIVRQTFETRQNAQSVLSLPINGQMRQLEVTTLLHQAPSARDEVIVLLYDLTTLLALERMQADFLANASHEFKTPLTAINGFVETLQGPAGEDSAVREQFLGIIENEAHRMTDLVNDVLSLSRIHYGEAGQDVSVVNLADFINEAWQSIQESAAHKDITFTNHVPRDLTVTISNGALKTLLANLLTNAVKYNQVGGQVIVNADMDLQHWTLRIEDTGIGIPKSQQNRVFERFYRGDASRQRRIADGTGLGLAIVQELVQQLNGQIQLQSQVGVGTTFQVTLPKI
jgi:two-component system phosphate regulon sensor histidine kinase PhoR